MMHGRSMIEMLGILAIIGVLSIGGLVSYKQAMTRYHNNQLIDFVSQLQLATMDLCTNDCPFNSGTSYDEYQENQAILCSYNPIFCSSKGNRVDIFPFPVGWNIRKSGTKSLSFYLSGISIETCQSIVQQKWHRLYSIHVDYLYGSNKPEPATNGVLNNTQIERLQAQCAAPVNRNQYIIMTWYFY